MKKTLVLLGALSCLSILVSAAESKVSGGKQRKKEKSDNPLMKKVDNWYHGINKKKVIFAVNAGSEEKGFTDDAGIKYMADSEDYVTGGQTTAGCGMHHWPFENMEVYHSERWGEQFTYKVPFSLEKDG